MLMFPIDSDMVQAGVSGGGSLPMHIDLFYEVRHSHSLLTEEETSTQ